MIDEISKAFSIPINNREHDLMIGRGHIHSCETVLAKPMAFMNRSGPPVLLLLDEFGLKGEDMLVIHDDLDLDFGRIKIKEKGGHGGHRGITSLMNSLGSGDFKRLRMGIGRPAPGDDVVDHVLGGFTADEAEELPRFIGRGREAAVTVLCKGTREGMNRFNRNTQNLT